MTTKSQIDPSYMAFMEDVVNEVYLRFEGKYTKEQIWDVFDASISYIHSIMKYTENMSIRIPHIGHMWVNKREMMMRVQVIKKFMAGNKGKATKKMLKELEMLEKRIAAIPDNLVNGHPLVTNVVKSRMALKGGRSWDNIQDFQNKIIF